MLLVADFNLCKANPYGPAKTMPITIKNDGSVDPANSPLKHVGGNQYVLTENLNATIVSIFERYVYQIYFEKDNIVIDGANHTVDGPGRFGIEIAYRNNVTIRNIALSSYEIGVEIWCSSNINITGNSILSGERGITISNSSNVVIAENIFADNREQTTIDMKYSNSTIIYGNKLSCIPETGWLISGLRMDYCPNNFIVANTITGFYSGITLLNSSNNYFYQNNLIDNNIQAQDLLQDESYQRMNEQNKQMKEQNFPHPLYPVWDFSTNIWKNNYWSNYNGSSGSDGVGDSPYIIDERNVDNSPFTRAVTLDQTVPLSSINFTEEATVDYSQYLSAILASAVIIVIIIATTAILYKKKSNSAKTDLANNQVFSSIH